MNAYDLYVLAEQQNIEVIETSLPENGSLSLMDDAGNCYIGIDESVMDGGALEIVHMAHELGHCLTGSFYNRHTVRHPTAAREPGRQMGRPSDHFRGRPGHRHRRRIYGSLAACRVFQRHRAVHAQSHLPLRPRQRRLRTLLLIP